MLVLSARAPAHLGKLGYIVVTQKRDHIPLRTTVLFIHKILYFLFENSCMRTVLGVDRVESK